MPDEWEDSYVFLDRLNGTDAGLDEDGDELTNLQEFQNNTLPNNIDSDGDGFYDGEEIRLGSEPDNGSSTPIYQPDTYVADITTGNDVVGLGTTLSPWKSIHHAVSRINSGSLGVYTLQVAPGTYNIANGEPFDVTPIIITQDQVTVAGPGSTALLDGGTWNVGLKIEASNVTINNIAFTNFSWAGIELSSGAANRIEGCEIYTNYYGIYIGPGASNNQIQSGNRLYHNLRAIWIHGGDNNLIFGMDNVYDNDIGIGIEAWNSGDTADNNEVFDNTIYWSGDADYVQRWGVWIGGYTQYAGTGNKIYRNTIFGSTAVGSNSCGIDVLDGNPEISRNIIYNYETGIRMHYDSSAIVSPLIVNNLIHDVQFGIYIDGRYISGGSGPDQS